MKSLIDNVKTKIIITHTLTSTKKADYIYVLDNGRIIECGNHETLILKKGKYYTMFQTQASWYED
ncbi:hypothetical protein [Mammaliicoccus sciuri]|uniref:hypothetical protein n=1 Tax=Mammaliicoccus sciuri TaxID=1296 RepID=UPI0034DD2C96